MALLGINEYRKHNIIHVESTNRVLTGCCTLLICTCSVGETLLHSKSQMVQHTAKGSTCSQLISPLVDLRSFELSGTMNTMNITLNRATMVASMITWVSP